jgi:hypothetical protein
MAKEKNESGEKEFVSKAYRPYEEAIAGAFEVFYSELLQLQVEDWKRSRSAVEPECWKSLMRYIRWGGRIAFETKLSRFLETIGASIYGSLDGAEDGVILRILIPASIFVSDGLLPGPSAAPADKTQQQSHGSNRT